MRTWRRPERKAAAHAVNPALLQPRTAQAQVENRVADQITQGRWGPRQACQSAKLGNA
jgi:hypothetical protein